MLTAPNLHQFAHEDKARRARHAEIDVRYAWLARQSGAWPAGESRKYPRGSPQLLCRIRLRELEALYGARYGGTLPYDDAGIDDLKIAAHHIGHMGGDAIGHIVAWADMWMPDLPRERAKAIARDIVDDPVKFKAATLAWRLRLTEQERTTLGIKTIRPFGVSDADMKERRKAKRRERERERRRRRSKPKKAPLRETRPWQDLGISRSTWYRRNPGRRGETKPCGQQVPLSTNMQASQFVSLAQQRKKAIRAGTDHPEVCPSRKAAAKSLGRRRLQHAVAPCVGRALKVRVVEAGETHNPRRMNVERRRLFLAQLLRQRRRRLDVPWCWDSRCVAAKVIARLTEPR